MRLAWIPLLALLPMTGGCVEVLASVSAPPAARERSALRTRVVFTDAMSQHRDPVNDLRQVPLAPVPFYVFVSWLDIEPGDHAYKLEIYDGVGELVNVQRMSFANPDASWSTWSWYRPKPGVDAPGTWRFELSLDGSRVRSEELEVQP